MSSPRLLEHLGAEVELVTDRGSDAAMPLATVRLAVEAIVPPPEDRRLRNVDDDQLAALATSLRDHGQLQAIGVRSRPDSRYELIFGSRRLEAARRAGLRDISATVFNATDDQSLVIALVENLHRRALSGPERVQGLRMLAAVHRPGTQPGGRGCGPGKLEPPAEQPNSFSGLARKLSVSQPTVARWVKLAHAPELLEAVETGELSFTTASFIASAPEAARADVQAQLKRGELAPDQVRDRVRALCRVQRSHGAGPVRFGDADATSRVLKRVLAELELVVAVSSDAEREMVVRVLREAERLLAEPS